MCWFISTLFGSPPASANDGLLRRFGVAVSRGPSLLVPTKFLDAFVSRITINAINLLQSIHVSMRVGANGESGKFTGRDKSAH